MAWGKGSKGVQLSEMTFNIFDSKMYLKNSLLYHFLLLSLRNVDFYNSQIMRESKNLVGPKKLRGTIPVIYET